MAFYTIHARNIANLRFEKQPLVVDVREPEEYRNNHMRGAINVPYRDDEDWTRNFSGKRALLLYCEYGSTSLLAARRLGKEGFEVYTVIGGARAIRDYHGDAFNN